MAGFCDALENGHVPRLLCHLLPLRVALGGLHTTFLWGSSSSPVATFTTYKPLQS